ncbi:MAG: MotA/TolQ/ExbB proton channel family protein [Caldimicrobium sp.]
MEFLKFFLQAGLVGKIVLLILFVMSFISWYYIFLNLFLFNKVKKNITALEMYLEQGREFSELVKEIRFSSDNLITQSLRRALTKFAETYNFYKGLEKNLQKKFSTEAEKELDEAYAIERERVMANIGVGLGFLATTANTAPFIGLFGTVWGIMRSFHEIGLKGSATLATVAPGIAEALINTAMGLFVAIPASMAYNYFLLKKEKIGNELERLYGNFKIISQRELLK